MTGILRPTAGHIAYPIPVKRCNWNENTGAFAHMQRASAGHCVGVVSSCMTRCGSRLWLQNSVRSSDSRDLRRCRIESKRLEYDAGYGRHGGDVISGWRTHRTASRMTANSKHLRTSTVGSSRNGLYAKCSHNNRQARMRHRFTSSRALVCHSGYFASRYRDQVRAWAVVSCPAEAKCERSG
jgi:hypothetical protein